MFALSTATPFELFYTEIETSTLSEPFVRLYILYSISLLYILTAAIEIIRETSTNARTVPYLGRGSAGVLFPRAAAGYEEVPNFKFLNCVQFLFI